VRSAYKICVNSAGTQDRHGIAGSWNEIWRAKIPPKVKNLLWRIGRNVLPTRMHLYGRGVHCPTNCSVCNEGDEDTLHVLFFCHKSIQCWQQVGLWDIVSTCLNTNNSFVKISLSFYIGWTKMIKNCLVLWCGAYGSGGIIKFGRISPSLIKLFAKELNISS
jgi:hypothetical protein